MSNNTLSQEIENSIIDDKNPYHTGEAYLSDEQKTKQIEKYMEGILLTLGLDLKDPSLKDTPKRIAKMYVEEFFHGLSPANFPKLTFIPNTCTSQGQMILTRDILVQSICEHHFLPMIGTAHIAYIPKDKIIGLSKINRIVEYFSKRPQLQEKLTHQICHCISHVLNTNDVAVCLELTHFCMQYRGIKDPNSKTITSEYLGKFQSEQTLKDEFYTKISR